MTITRILGAALLGAGSLAALAAQPANAAVNPANCTWGYNLSINQVSATCYNPTATNWYLRLGCDRFDGRHLNVNGTLVYGPGTGTSIARCPANTEIVSETIINL